MERKKVTPQDLLLKKQQGEKTIHIVCYDYIMASLVDKAGIDTILVGDSAAMVMMGETNTLAVSMDEMIYHCKGVTRAVKYSLVVGDLPFLSYQTGIRDAIYNAGLFMKYGGVDAVKMEGGQEFAATVKAMVDAGIPVAGSIGLMPQSMAKVGGYKVQGGDAATARKLIDDAMALEAAGAFILDMECVPDRLTKIIREKLTIPVYGIGCGPYTDGQFLNIYDLVGLFERFTPKFVKKYGTLSQDILKMLEQYKEEVERGLFPGAEHTFHMKDEVLKTILDDASNVK
jgi:3-methyl-2-oxobutanoate hydroxymethyltransferase